MNMKKWIVLICTIICTVVLCSCENEKEERLYLSGQVEDNENKRIGGFKDCTEYGINTKSEITKYNDVRKKVNVVIGSNQEKMFTYWHSDCKKKNDESDEYGSFYGRYDYYINDDTIISYLHGTDTLCFYHKSHSDSENDSMKNETEIREIAEKFLISVMGEETFSNFSFIQMQTGILDNYVLFYTREIEGYKTDENISIWIERTGEVTGYNAYNLKKYDTIKNNIKKEDVENTKLDLQNKLRELNLIGMDSLDDVRIITNVEGEVFIKGYFDYITEEGETIREDIYVKIE